MNRATVKHAFFAYLPVMAGYIVLGIGFGVFVTAKGYAFWWAPLMSLLIYAGTLQFVGIGLMASGGSLITMAVMTLMVNARHLFYGITMIGRYRELGWRRAYAIFALTDETYSLICGNTAFPDGVSEKDFIFWVTLIDHSYWVLGSALGGILGSALTFNSTGIDFSMTALFICIFVERWEKTKQHIPALMGLCVSVICLLIFGADQFLIPTMIGVSTGLLLMRKKLERGEADHV